MVRTTPEHGAAGGAPHSRPLSGMRVLGITPTPTHPATAGNRARYAALLDRLQELGATIRVIHIEHEPGSVDAMAAHWNGGAVRVPFRMPTPRHHRWRRLVDACRRRFGVSLPMRADVDDWCDPATAAPVAAEIAAFAPDAILMVYIWNSRLLEQVPDGVLRVLDAQDVFTDRDARMRQAGVAQQWFSVSAREEARGLNRFDVILAIQEHEATHYRRIARPGVVTVGHLLPVFPDAPPSAVPRLLIVASDNAVNVDGVRWFIAESWPLIRSAIPDATLEIAGRVCTALSDGPGLVLTGPVADLADVYARSQLVVNPLRGGTGLKIKAAEAMAAGRVVLSTPAAAEGLEAAIGRGMVIGATASELADLAIALLRDPAAVAAGSADARQFAAEWNAAQASAFDAVFIARATTR